MSSYLKFCVQSSVAPFVAGLIIGATATYYYYTVKPEEEEHDQEKENHKKPVFLGKIIKI
jgi:uncharacterized membrane protein YedE/YeeE